jgi:hypothetical protein
MDKKKLAGIGAGLVALAGAITQYKEPIFKFLGIEQAEETASTGNKTIGEVTQGGTQTGENNNLTNNISF